MNDQCRTCNLRGDMKKCEPVPCFNRDNWYAQEIIKERDALKDRLARIDAERGKDAAAWAATSEEGKVEALGFNQSRRFDTPLFLSAPTIPEGYWLAPNEPTSAICDALAFTDAERESVWDALKAAAQGERK